MAGKPGRSGRPSLYSDNIADEICRKLADGESLIAICRAEHLPAESTVRGWALDDLNGFFAKYARARDIGIEHELDEVKEISDTILSGKKLRTYMDRCSVCDGRGAAGLGKRRRKCSKCNGSGRVEVTETVTGDMVERAKLQVDTRKWRICKIAPKKYGDRSSLRFVDEEGKDRALTIADIDAIVSGAA